MHTGKTGRNRYRYRNEPHPGRQDASSRDGKPKEPVTTYYAYGKNAAIEFRCDETPKQKINTITMHAASAHDDGKRGYDWESKTVIRIPRNELLVVMAIMLGSLPRGDFVQTGAHAGKRFAVEHQDEKLFFMVAEEGKPIRAVGLSPEDSCQVAMLFLRQLKANSPWMTTAEIIDLIDMTVVTMKQARGDEDAPAPEDEPR